MTRGNAFRALEELRDSQAGPTIEYLLEEARKQEQVAFLRQLKAPSPAQLMHDERIEAPIGTRHILDRASERAAQLFPSDRALEILGVVGMVAPAFLSAITGNPDLALVQAQMGAVAAGVVGVAQAVRG